MVRRRRSPTPEELDRIAEELFNRAEFQIQDRDSFDLAFQDYMGFSDADVKTDSDKRKFQDNAFREYQREHPEVSSERLFQKAGGKGVRGLRIDRKTTAKRVVKTRKAFIREGATAVDLQAFDTVRQRITKDIRERRRFTIPATRKGKVVFARRDSVVVLGKSQVRFRDARGRFVSQRAK